MASLPHRPRAGALGATLLALALGSASAGAQTAIVTHHFNNARTGWNRTETVLTPATVGTPGPAGTFGLLQTVPLDTTAEAQPLVAPNIVVTGDPNPGTHDVVYVATQGNTVYAIDPTRGTVLLSRNLGLPVPQEIGCGHTVDQIGITSTPVLDLARHALFVVAYTNDSTKPDVKSVPVYRLHALDLSTLQDKRPPVVITAQATLSDGSTLPFHPVLHRQRPALLEQNRNIYVSMGAFCDAPRARGWVMAYSADTLKPLATASDGVPAPGVTNHRAHAPNGVFLSSLWMSDAGPAADADSIYYVTGNSDPAGTTYDPVTNTAESIVRLSTDTQTVLDVFTPSNMPYLEQYDRDFGAGGVTLIPNVEKFRPPMAAAAGKIGTMFLVDRTNMGGYTAGGPDKVLDQVAIGPCWCQPSYFNDGTPTLVSSGGQQIILWQVKEQPKVALVQRDISPVLNTNAFGFFTSVSSNGQKNAIVWAVTHQNKPDTTVFLYAFGVNKMGTPISQLFYGPAGTWNEPHHFPNIVPVVANGRVYVASDSGLEVFGLAPPGGGSARQ